ncbi:hypothetical protein ACKTEK_11910 [Tepidamorphus sp. 3E244]|uniref:hypothetical protein n=1 Tax=Tepidamorphus sp. 3E244 TaxID=3385498 RepID=UPI0038FC4FDD
MIEWIMLFALGFCTAGILAVLAIPVIWRRAAKITGRRIRGALPVSMGEIQADKDQMRAEFAMAARKLERSIEELKQKSARHQAEIGKRDEVIRSQKVEIINRRRTEEELLERVEKLDSRLSKQDKELSTRDNAIEARDSTLAERQSALSRRDAEIAELNTLSDTRRVEVVALKTRMEALKANLSERDENIAKLKARITEAEDEMKSVRKMLAERETELSARDGEVRRLRQSIDKQEKAIAEADSNIAGLKRALATERKLVTEKDREIDTATGSMSERNAEAGRLAAQLATANKQRVRAEEKLQKLETELTELRAGNGSRSRAGVVANGNGSPVVADKEWETEKRENALLREHLNDLAAEVVSLTSALDGDNGEIRNMADDLVSTPAGGESKSAQSLADRIRALQSQVARH